MKIADVSKFLVILFSLLHEALYSYAKLLKVLGIVEEVAKCAHLTLQLQFWCEKPRCKKSFAFNITTFYLIWFEK